MIKTTWRWLYRISLLALLLAGFGFAAVILALRYWLLPNIEHYREDIASSLSQAAGQYVAIGGIAANWDGLRPHLDLQQVQIYDQKQRPALYLNHIETTLSWWSLAVGEIRLHSLLIDEPVLTVRREKTGLIYIAGIQLNQPDSRHNFADWILQQRHITVRNAAIQWLDGLRQAPPLVLGEVNVRLENTGRRHQFGLRATPPAALAQPLDIRGDLRGATARDFSQWQGMLYARIDKTDMAAWRNWVPLPFELQQGFGGLRLWLAFVGKDVNEITADVHLSGVKTRLAEDLPELHLNSMSGRLAWRNLAPGFEFSASRLGLALQEGPVLPAADIKLLMVPAQGKKPARGELEVDKLSLGPLAELANYVPLEGEVVQLLAQLAPRGSFRDFTAKWRGEWSAPLDYQVRGRFTDAGANPYGAPTGPTPGARLPGFSGLSGSLNATEKGGALSLNSRQAMLEFPGILAEPLQFDTLTAQVRWDIRSRVPEFEFSNVSFANAHLAGSAFGRYRAVAGTPGWLDVTGQLTRADARQVSRYIPLKVGADTRDWLARSILAGQSNDVRLRLTGNLADFPFAGAGSGLFQVSGRFTGGMLDYAVGWPRIENIAGDLLFHGSRMEINVPQARIFGVNLTKVRVQIPDLLVFDERLGVEGTAQGPTSDFLKFVSQSPVTGMIDGFTEGMQAAGPGTLALRLDIPLRHRADSRVVGSYRFLNNRIIAAAETPEISQVQGTLSFTEAAVNAQLACTVLGGAASINATSQKDGTVRIAAQGKVTAAGLRQFSTQPLLQRVQGATDWRSVISLRKKQADVTIDSSLLGLALDLPVPLRKSAAEAIPLHLEKKLIGPQRDSLSLSWGKLLSAQLLGRWEDGRPVIERGAISLGGAPAVPAERGVWLSGELPFLDLDEWRSLFGPARAKPLFELAGLDLRFATLDAFGKRLRSLHVSGWRQGEVMRFNLAGQEMQGEASWNPQGRGKLTARLKNLTLPPAAPQKTGAPAEETTAREMPALDIIAEGLEVGLKKMGRLELLAVQENNDWRLEKLRLSSPDSTLKMDGIWQDWMRQPQTRVNLQLEVHDIGKLLARFGYPDAVRRGTAKFSGKLSWAGAPQDFNFPTMVGDLSLEAHKGQFLKIDPGIGKLLGILSLQALPRRITLDFRDVFSDGFAFDNVSSTLRIARGVVSSNDFVMEGPAAKVNMSGETDLERETQNLRVKVTPSMGESVSMAGALLGGPVVGLTTLLVQKALKNPIGWIISYEYGVTGTWDNPVVTKMARSPDKAE